MEFITDLNELEVGDWVKVIPKEPEKSYFKIGEITHKWHENDNPRFQLDIKDTNLPYTTKQLIDRLWQKVDRRIESKEKIRALKKDRVYRLNEKEKDKIIKKQILERLK